MIPLAQSPQKSFWSSDLFFILLIPISLLVFYPELFFAKNGALTADHLEQHYPWAFLFAQELRHGRLPFWTPLIQCGFPLAAEGQVGVFYLPNIILYLLLPFQWAYSYNQLFHFFVAGLGTYLYCRRMKMDPVPAFVAAFIYLFGTSYGGAYYNITSLKTLAWFPFLLLIFERATLSPQKRNIGFLALVLSLMTLAGYLQIAALAFFIFFLYAFLRLTFFRSLGLVEGEIIPSRLRVISHSVLGGLLALLICFPQLFLTYQLAMLSNRAAMTEGYAYVGSLSPGALATLILPLTQGLFRGNSLYLGIFSLFLLLFAVYSPREHAEKKLSSLWGWLILIVLFLALGQWSPLYVGLVKLAHFYSFRTPAKLLIFICFGLSVLCGLGFQKAWAEGRDTNYEAVTQKVSRGFICLVMFAGILASTVCYLLAVHRSLLEKLGNWCLSHFIFQRTGHSQTLVVYQAKLAGYLNQAAALLSFRNPWAQWSYSLLIVGVIFALILWRSKKVGRVWLWSGLVFLAVDIYVFSFFDVKTDFDTYAQIEQRSPVVMLLEKELKTDGGGRVYGFRQASEELPFVPNTNMLYGFEDIGVYSPLVPSRYYETIGKLGNVNDSNFTQSPSPGFVLDRLNLLNFLDMAFVLSTQKLVHSDLVFLASDPKMSCFLYRNTGRHARAFFISECRLFQDWEALKDAFLKPGFDPRKTLLLERSELQKLKTIPSALSQGKRVVLNWIRHDDTEEHWEIETDQSGFFVISNAMFPGWSAEMDGRVVPILYADGLFQGVWIEGSGRHKISLHFRPFTGAIFHKKAL